jgi:hypothetical protein
LPHEFRIFGEDLSSLLLGFDLGSIFVWGSSHLGLLMLETLS